MAASRRSIYLVIASLLFGIVADMKQLAAHSVAAPVPLESLLNGRLLHLWSGHEKLRGNPHLPGRMLLA